MLFTARNMEKNKEIVYKMWKIRIKRLQEQNLIYNSKEHTHKHKQIFKSPGCVLMVLGGAVTHRQCHRHTPALSCSLCSRRPRPLLIKLKDARAKWEIVRNGKNIKDTRKEHLKRAVIVPDQTRREREKSKKLRDELQEKRDNGEEGWFIKRGQLVKKRIFYKQKLFKRKQNSGIKFIIHSGANSSKRNRNRTRN